MTVPEIVRSPLIASKGKGMTKLQTTIAQNRGAKPPRCVCQKTAISDASLPYQVVSLSAKTK